MISVPLRHPSLYMLTQNHVSVKTHYSNDTFYIDECDLGLGMFARRFIPDGEVIFVFGGSIIDFVETKRRGPWECMPIQIGHDQYIDTLPPGVFVNHSCNPNSGIREDTHLVALQDLYEGDEIRFDYSTTMEEHSFTMPCRCGASNCREIVADFSTLPFLVRKRYISQKIVMSFIIKMLHPV